MNGESIREGEEEKTNGISIARRRRRRRKRRNNFRLQQLARQQLLPLLPLSLPPTVTLMAAAYSPVTYFLSTPFFCSFTTPLESRADKKITIINV